MTVEMLSVQVPTYSLAWAWCHTTLPMYPLYTGAIVGIAVPSAVAAVLLVMLVVVIGVYHHKTNSGVIHIKVGRKVSLNYVHLSVHSYVTSYSYTQQNPQVFTKVVFLLYILPNKTINTLIQEKSRICSDHGAEVCSSLFTKKHC